MSARCQSRQTHVASPLPRNQFHIRSPPCAASTSSSSPALWVAVPPTPQKKDTDPLKEETAAIGFAYHKYHDTFGKGPATIADLKKNILNDAKFKDLHVDDYVINPDLEFKILIAKRQSAWIDHHKDVPSKGGYVFMLDGTVQQSHRRRIQGPLLRVICFRSAV